MLSSTPRPPLTPLTDVDARLASDGYAVIDAKSLSALAALEPERLAGWARLWHELPPDAHLRDGGNYRRRRHGCFIVDGTSVAQSTHRAHWQPLAYNALHGGIERWFDPLDAAWAADPALASLLAAAGGRATALRGPRRWFVEVHPFRIDTAGGIGRPTPEGAHRDGVDLVVVILVARHGIKGGETRVFDAFGPRGVRFTLDEPWSALFLDDERIIHETTPIQPQQPGQPGWRDTLVLTFRGGGFQGPPPA